MCHNRKALGSDKIRLLNNCTCTLYKFRNATQQVFKLTSKQQLTTYLANKKYKFIWGVAYLNTHTLNNYAILRIAYIDIFLYSKN